MTHAVIVLGIVAEIVLIVALLHAIRVLARIGRAADHLTESIDLRLAEVADAARPVLDEARQTARDFRSRSEQMGRVLREMEGIAVALGVLVGAREIAGSTVSSIVGGGMRRLSQWLAKFKPTGGESR
jgi:hypothetical protein